MTRRKRVSNNPAGRPRSGNADVQHLVRVSVEADRLLRFAAKREGITLSAWWRRAVAAGLSESASAIS